MTLTASSARYFIASGCPIATTTLYRCIHLQEQLQALGHEVRVVDWFDEAKIGVEEALGYDIIVLYRLPMSGPLERLIDAARRLGKLLIFDVDDLVFEPELVAEHRAVKNLSPSDQVHHLEGVHRYLATLRACDAVTVATPLLAEFARKRGQPAFVHRNALGREMQALSRQLYKERQSREIGARVVIGYGSGTATHDVDFLEVTPALARVLERFPNLDLWIAGPLVLPAALEKFAERVKLHPLTDWQGWFRLMARMDIAIAPLEMGNVFCRAKSEIKFVEAGALGLPLVASKIDPYLESMTNGTDGFLAANEEEWFEALTSLIEDPRLRTRLGEAARQTVIRSYSPEARIADLSHLLTSLALKLAGS